MRRTVFAGIAVVLLAGCCHHESASNGDPSAESAEAECKTGSCCSSVSRSAVLNKKAEPKVNEETR